MGWSSSSSLSPSASMSGWEFWRSWSESSCMLSSWSSSEVTGLMGEGSSLCMGRSSSSRMPREAIAAGRWRTLGGVDGTMRGGEWATAREVGGGW